MHEIDLRNAGDPDAAYSTPGIERRPDFVAGAIDLHIHSGPDVAPRIGTSVDIARAAAAAGMRAIVLKDHLFPSFPKAVVTDQLVDDIRVFGGIAMNATAGGISARTVRAAIIAGARVVMFPTQDATRFVEAQNPSLVQRLHSTGSIEPIAAAREGKLVGESSDVLEAVAEHSEIILSSGHLGPEEAIPVMTRAAELGIKRLVVEHPNSKDWWTRDHYTQLLEIGCYFNLSYSAYHKLGSNRPFNELCPLIDFLTPQRCALITDGGQPYNPMPATLLQVFCEMIYAQGMSTDDIRVMTHDVPGALIDWGIGKINEE